MVSKFKDLDDALWRDIRRLRAIRRSLDKRREGAEVLTQERLKIWIRLHDVLSYRELGELSQVGHTYVKKEVDKA